jgi:hypothetical protein
MRLADLRMLRDPYVLDLVDQAAANAPRPDGKVKHAIVVKVYEGPKRRPKAATAHKPAKAKATPRKAGARRTRSS